MRVHDSRYFCWLASRATDWVNATGNPEFCLESLVEVNKALSSTTCFFNFSEFLRPPSSVEEKKSQRPEGGTLRERRVTVVVVGTRPQLCCHVNEEYKVVSQTDIHHREVSIMNALSDFPIEAREYVDRHRAYEFVSREDPYSGTGNSAPTRIYM